MNKDNQVSFEGQVIYTGIDVHKKDNQLSIYLNQQFYKTIRMPSQGEKIVNYLTKHFPGASYKSAYEAGFSGYSLHRYLLANGVDNIVVHASDVPMSNKDREQKSDKRDSKQIGKCLSAGLLSSIYVPDQEQVADRCLHRYRDKVVTDLTRIRVRIKMWLHFTGNKIPSEFDNSSWSKNFVNWLKGLELAEPSLQQVLSMMIDQLQVHRQWLLKINGQLKDLSKKARYQKDYQLLLSIPGIGPVGAWRILTEIGDITRFSSTKKLCSYVGLIPNSRSSGEKSYKGRITHRCNKKLRSQLIESAWCCIQLDPSMALSYNKLVKGKMKRNRAIVSIARKLLCRIRAVLQSGQGYEINYANQQV